MKPSKTNYLFADYHVHTDYSDDSWYLMEDVVKDAIAMGLEELCFTDHVDYGIKPDWDHIELAKEYHGKKVLNVNYPLYFEEFEKLKETYKDQITLKIGLEFGMQMHTVEPFKRLYQSYQYDFILLSVHQVGDKEFWTGEFQEGHTELESYDIYYQELYDLVTTYHDYSCLAHMDLVRRYLDKETDQFAYCKPMIEQILKVVIADGKGIEVNTSSHRYGINGLTPSLEILKLYHELGGTIITVGSDSHQKDHLGAYIHESIMILKSIGFTHICSFDQMKPIFHEI